MAGRIEAALSQLTAEDPTSNITAIKAAVTQQLMEADATVTVAHTDYFNHTFAPDMVLRWRGETAERRVYLRTDTRADSLTDDLRWITVEEPIVVPLGTVNSIGEEDGSQRLDSAASSTNTMVADSGALAAFDDDDSGHGREILRQNFLRGGRGLVDETRVRSTRSSLVRAFDGAQRGDTEVVREAVDATEILLANAQSGIVNRFLQAVWVASGAPASNFPGATGATGALDQESLQFLLDSALMQDSEFWARVGRNVSLNRLVALRVPASNDAFQVLVSSAAQFVRARGAFVTSETLPTDNREGEDYRWSADGAFLRLSAPGRFTVSVPPGRMSQASPPEQPLPGEGASYRSIFERLPDNAEVARLSFRSSTGSSIHWEAGVPTRAADDALLADWTSSLDEVPAAVAALLHVGSGRQMQCDFLAGRISGPTNSSFWLSELLGIGTRVLIGGAREDFDLLALTPNEGARQALDLEEVRAWARDEGLEVGEVGDIPPGIVDVFLQGRQAESPPPE